MSTNRFYNLKVEKIEEVTSSAKAITFSLDSDQREQFKFIQGQYLTFKINLNGEEHRRSYSICSGVDENSLKVAVKEVENGTISKFLNRELQQGNVLESMTPEGRFYTELDPGHSKKYILFAAGSGITPILSILKSILSIEPNSSVQLHYGNSNREQIMFKDELNKLHEEFNGRFQLLHYLSQESASSPYREGRIDINKIANDSTLSFDLSEADEYFLCGPEKMINEISDHLNQIGATSKTIHYELFTSDNQVGSISETGSADNSNADLKGCSVEVTLDGDVTNFNLDTSGQTVLETAIAAGIDPPYSCRGGVCTTCMARLKEGTVKMDMNHALTDDELEEGYILTCQSHPTSQVVKINYDDI